MLTCALQSGSNGNCIYVEAGDVRLLFDAGISGRQARERLATHGRDIRDVSALVLSHSHADHTRCAGVYQRLFGLPLYMTRSTLRTAGPYLGQLDHVSTFTPGATLEFDSVRVHTLRTPHDAPDAVAFIVEHDGRRLGILTDLGHPFAALALTLGELDALYLESNFDLDLLVNGTYPEPLKARIRGGAGHLSNHEAADLLARCRQRFQWVALAHLSEHNNTPELALETHRQALGRHYPLHVASRYSASDLFQV